MDNKSDPNDIDGTEPPAADKHPDATAQMFGAALTQHGEQMDPTTRARFTERMLSARAQAQAEKGKPPSK